MLLRKSIKNGVNINTPTTNYLIKSKLQSQGK